MELIGIGEHKWTSDLKSVHTEMNKLSDADKIQGFRNEAVENM